jgi:hypothetical protein
MNMNAKQHFLYVGTLVKDFLDKGGNPEDIPPLPLDLNRMWKLRIGRGLTYREIMEETGLSRHTVGALCTRTILTVKRRLKKHTPKTKT